MAFNWQTFRTRTLTAAVFVAIMLTGLLWNFWSFLILFSVIHFGCWWEYLKLTEKICNNSYHFFAKLGIMLIGYGIMIWLGKPNLNIADYFLDEKLVLFFFGIGLLLFFTGLLMKPVISFKEFTQVIFGALYISLTLGMMIDMHGVGASILCVNGVGVAGLNYICNHFLFPFVIIPLCIIISLWINDTMAYIVGSLFGKTPLTKISPKKTWEGTLGGILLSIVLVGLVFSNLNPELVIQRFRYGFSSTSIWYIIPAVSSITGAIGDIFESKLKRMAGVKDSGTLMPGHGGFLDRFDSLLFATPFVWLYVQFFLT